MAVAVKTSPGARSFGSLASPAILSLIGVLYLLVCLAVVFEGIPWLWKSAWQTLNLGAQGWVSGTLLGLVCLAVAVGLLWFGARLLGPDPPVGVRSGVFVGFLGLLVVVLLTRWASMWLEYWAFTDTWLNWSTGAILTGVVGVALLLAWVWLFTRPGMQAFTLRFEQGGWFHATSYKSNQGLKVRRGTMIGLLLLIGAGVWALVSHGTLRRGSPDLELNVPFTDRVIVDDIGNAKGEVAKLPLADKKDVQVRWPGAKSNLKAKEFLGTEDFKARVNAILAAPESGVPANVQTRLTNAATDQNVDIIDYLLLLNHEIHARLVRLMNLHRTVKGAWLLGEEDLDIWLLRDDVRRRLEELDNRTDWTDISELIVAVQREVDAAVTALTRDNERALRALKEKKPQPRATQDRAEQERAERERQEREREEARERHRVQARQQVLAEAESLRWVFRLPTAVLLVDRFALKQANANLKPTVRVRVGLTQAAPDFELAEDQVVSRAEFDQAVVNLYVKRAKPRLETDPRGREILAKLRQTSTEAEFVDELNEALESSSGSLRARLEAVEKDLGLARSKPGEAPKRIVPPEVPLIEASGPVQFATIPLLPAVQFTVPLLLLALAMWLAWRVVNLPSFADFLIATEAELNKVSWTTQRRLAQDTVVVLATVLLMSVFLFTTDYFWKTVLSWKPIGVLHIPEDSGKDKQKLADKRW